MTTIREFIKENRRKKPVPFVAGETEIPVTVKQIDENDLIGLVDTVLDEWFTDGKEARRFSVNLAESVQKSHAILVNSGSSANLLAVSALFEKYPNRRKVISCATGFPTTINSILQAGGELLIVDSDKNTLNASMVQLMSSLHRDDVAGVMLAHTLGFPFPEHIIRRTCRELGKWLISDCCDALGSEVNGEHVGYDSEISTYSFYPAHTITCGEGGAVATDDEQLSRIVYSLRDWGRDCVCPTGKDNTCHARFAQKFGLLPMGYDHKYVYSRLGYNFKMTDFQASLGRTQLEKLPQFIQKRRANYTYLKANLLDLQDKLSFPVILDGANPSPFGFPITVREGKCINKDRIVHRLEYGKIRTRPVFGGNLMRQPAYCEAGSLVERPWVLDDADYLMNNSFWIGCHPSLTKQMMDYMIEVLHEVIL